MIARSPQAEDVDGLYQVEHHKQTHFKRHGCSSVGEGFLLTYFRQGSATIRYTSNADKSVKTHVLLG
ncbi:hypothetical protein QVD17_08845 [Tagetes erecta]|uniref:Uncharacterized protein n=1 Tax=Tagetes erecta TaxID=13708 RepID=A0AAD8L376_TARER|nr:hypothetical protein QVD17_08845 [Tagetes erecta]